ncbi:protein-disulfide reductase DsbD family protein [Flavilitoribacter nigricans]|uniref:Cytochrome C biogenesis protein transmembrane domain-containing protein n=1 Tax=Flavilitoribacter nigricans (strain ATCC 23147 / DSM 23189 / NBRC 102662 / NCIMB 1420 / SS-2) TaxID=1122177 RepID=A0A2D0N7X0_FLAN2|nr:cytochrome c biogenesis protein CcdA [Flavilitoribacter nigricans]PHN04612.1 hypothetical protein CRP01_21655 [Flavilitoribacter nigricans DSM 23189 = NBRC 102662]
MRTIILAVFCLLSISLTGQILEPVKWKMTARHVDGNEFDLVFTAVMDEGWSLYSQHTSDDGPVPTSFNFDAGDHFSPMGEVSETGGKKKEGMDELFGVNVIKFVKGPVTFIQKVKVSDYSKPITGYLEFMTCDDERCLPPTEVDFNFELKPAVDDKKTGATDPAKTEAKPAPTNEKQTSVAATSKTGEDRAQQGAETKETETEPMPTISFGDAPMADTGDQPSGLGMVSPVSWSGTIEKRSDNEYEVAFTATMDEGWVVYSQYLNLKEDEIGPLPTTFFFDEADSFETVGETSEEGKKKEGMDPTFGVVVAKFVEKPVTFRQTIKVSDPSQVITGYVEYMTCDDKQCFPEDVSFEIDPANLRVKIGNDNGSEATVVTSGGGDFGYPRDPGSVKDPVGYCGEEITTVEGKGYWTIFFLGFLGGLVALLTPCVFPMVPLTVSFFTKGSENRRKGITNATMYGFFIFLVYLILSIPFHLMDSIDSSILNQVSTNIWLNVSFFIIFVFFAFSFFGYYEITLPSSWTNKASSAEGVGGMLGIFFMALTLALVSFSCTGPILGSLLAGALSSDGGAMQLTMGMGGFGLALALPFALFAAFPTWLSSLPKSGGWLNTVKVVLGFVELALAFKFLSNADLTKHWGLLKYEPFLAIWILIGIGLVLYLLGKIRFPHDSPLKKVSLGRLITAGLTIGFIGYMTLGFIYEADRGSYKPLKLLSGLAPPSCYSWLHPCDCPQNLDCFKDLEQGLAYAKKVNKPVMLDFTGYNCVNCRKMEEHVWPEPEVYSHLKEDYILISLYVDDREPATGEDAEKYRNIGKKWHKFQQEYFGTNSQPFYALVSPDGYLLNQPVAFTPDAEEYGDFLRCGLENFKQLTEGNIKPGDQRIGAN